MLPIATVQGVKDGTTSGMMIDLSDYMKKKDGATKTELNTLTEVVAGKLDVSPQHKHDISDVKDLQEELNSKYDTSKKYSYNVILSDSEKIPYFENPVISRLDISADSQVEGYIFYVDEKSGDLMITLKDVLIGTYSVASAKWSFQTDNSTIDNVDAKVTANQAAIAANGVSIQETNTKIDEYIAKTDAILKNHYEALLELCEKHGMVDGDGDGASNITPTED